MADPASHDTFRSQTSFTTITRMLKLKIIMSVYAFLVRIPIGYRHVHKCCNTGTAIKQWCPGSAVPGSSDS
jgi:hypothetical protein